jgi:hypothetical protein
MMQGVHRSRVKFIIEEAKRGWRWPLGLVSYPYEKRELWRGP